MFLLRNKKRYQQFSDENSALSVAMGKGRGLVSIYSVSALPFACSLILYLSLSSSSLVPFLPYSGSFSLTLRIDSK